MSVLEADPTKWERARLFSLDGIKGTVEQENRASSALLAVMKGVPDFAKDILADLGAPTPRPGKYQTYTQARFKLGDRLVIPDGVIQIDGTGGKTWTCLLEFKTAHNQLEPKQLEDYLDVARTYGYQCVLSVSNAISAQPDLHPVQGLDKRKLKNANLRHISWAEILQKALVRQNFAGIADTEQQWILEELIRYFRDERSGALGFTDMGSSWVSLRNKVAEATLRTRDTEATDIVERFEILMRFLAIKLTSQIGLNVTVHHSRGELEDASLRIADKVNDLCEYGTLSGILRIPDAISPLRIMADLRRERIDCIFEATAPGLTQEKAKVNWLTKQLKDATTPIQIEAYAKRARDGIMKPLAEVLEDPKVLCEPGLEIARFDISAGFKMGRRGNNLKDSSFIDSMLTASQTSYDQIGAKLKAWVKPPTPRYIKADPSPLDDITIRDNGKQAPDTVEQEAAPVQLLIPSQAPLLPRRLVISHNRAALVPA